MEKKPRISIVIPAFNEEDAIREGLDKLIEAQLHEKYEVIYVNDGSTDRTKEIIKEYPVKLYNHNVNKGYGAALKTGIRKAEGEKVIILDSDGQHDPKYVDELLILLEENDMVIGERTEDSYQVSKRKGGKKNDSYHRRVPR